MKMFLTKQVKEIDQYTILHEPVTSVDLMERAAVAFAEAFQVIVSVDHPIYIFAGPGNNGGDALVVSRLLIQSGYEVQTFLFNPRGKLSPECEENKKKLLAMSFVNFLEIKDTFVLPVLKETDVIVDGLFGSGLDRPLSGGFASLVRSINLSKAKVVAIDIPSGLFGEDNTDNIEEAIIKADRTFTFQFPKLSFFFPENNKYVGEWEVLDIGLNEDIIERTPSPYLLIEKDDIKALLKERSVFSYKGNYGHALLIAGSRGKAGAGVLAARSCLRSGVGLLTVHIPQGENLILQISVPEAMTSIDKNEFHLSEMPDLKPYRAIGIGPGIGLHIDSSEAFFNLLNNVKVPLVIDADALNMLDTQEKKELLPEGSILTPHIGEFNRLVNLDSSINSYVRLQAAMDFSERTKTFLVLKGAYTAICTPDRHCYINTTGNPGMATAGSGDVLTGIILSFLSQGYGGREAAILGVYIHGLAGDIASVKLSQEGMIAGDIVKNLTAAFREIKA